MYIIAVWLCQKCGFEKGWPDEKAAPVPADTDKDAVLDLSPILDSFKKYFSNKYPCTTDDNCGDNMPVEDQRKWQAYNTLLSIHLSKNLPDNTTKPYASMLEVKGEKDQKFIRIIKQSGVGHWYDTKIGHVFPVISLADGIYRIGSNMKHFDFVWARCTEPATYSDHVRFMENGVDIKLKNNSTPDTAADEQGTKRKTAAEYLWEYGIDTGRLNDDFNTNLFMAMERYAESYISKTNPAVPAVTLSDSDLEKMAESYTEKAKLDQHELKAGYDGFIEGYRAGEINTPVTLSEDVN